MEASILGKWGIIFMRFLSVLLLNKEARLFDTKAFLLKSFIAVLAGALVGQAIPYVSKDMVSLLFGLMLTLDPVNLTGLRNGFKQVEATIIGAVITGLLLMVLGYTPLSTAIVITATLYVSLLINWREFSVVAVFTSIYMSQLSQTDAMGNVSEIETFKLRIAALLAGVIIAFVVNYLFSVFGYRHMLEKRIYHLIDDLHNKLEKVTRLVAANADTESGIYNVEEIESLMSTFPSLFNNIDWIYSTSQDFKKDPSVKRNNVKKIRMEKIEKMNKLIREMTHLGNNYGYKLTKGMKELTTTEAISDLERTTQSLTILMENLNCLIHNKPVKAEISFADQRQTIPELRQMDENILHINELLKHY